MIIMKRDHDQGKKSCQSKMIIPVTNTLKYGRVLAVIGITLENRSSTH